MSEASRASGTGTPWSVLVVDDEPLARLRLRTLLAGHPAFHIAGECEDGRQALEAIRSRRPDVVFLDIRMPELDGVAVAQAIGAQASEGGPVPALVFVTAHDAHAAHAFDLDAIDYLVKPVDIDRFERAIERLEARLAAPAAPDEALRAALDALASWRPGSRYPSRFAVRDARGIYFVVSDDIERVEAEGNYVALWANGRRHLVRDSMRGIEERLDPERFVRVHRSAIVAVDRIRRLEPWGHGEYLITLTDGTRITSSRTHAARLQQLLR